MGGKCLCTQMLNFGQFIGARTLHRPLYPWMAYELKVRKRTKAVTVPVLLIRPC